MTRSIDYGKLMHRAMRNLIQDVLCDVRDNGLPGAHHFFITFETTHPETNIADWLKERYPSEMTVVMQHWFDNLTVTDDGFSVTLNFGDQPENLYIPYDAIQTFVDPSVEFGLRFESQEDEDEEDTASQTDSSDEEVAAPEPDTAVRSGCGQPRQFPQIAKCPGS
nr:ClpXP protease specificity-enhancing factor SspB [Roseovarius sp. W115]MDV2928317.1 ClpXP protease specificity-enhancing factor SspB [Roseovarius sp. W115]